MCNQYFSSLFSHFISRLGNLDILSSSDKYANAIHWRVSADIQGIHNSLLIFLASVIFSHFGGHQIKYMDII